MNEIIPARTASRLSVENVRQRLQTTDDGLSEMEARKRLNTFGPNGWGLFKRNPAPRAEVLRDRCWRPVPARDLVPGDVVRVKPGGVVPADLKMLPVGHVQLGESSAAAGNRHVPTSDGDMALCGALVESGELQGIVTVTGVNTVFGRAARKRRRPHYGGAGQFVRAFFSNSERERLVRSPEDLRQRLNRACAAAARPEGHSISMIAVSQVAVVSMFLILTVANDLADLPHYLFGDAATSLDQRVGEIGVELLAYAAVMAVEWMAITRLRRRIRLLEGLIPICSNCKKIRDHGNWKEVEIYVEDNSCATFTHSLCPECLQELYPDLASDITQAESRSQ